MVNRRSDAIPLRVLSAIAVMSMVALVGCASSGGASSSSGSTSADDTIKPQEPSSASSNLVTVTYAGLSGGFSAAIPAVAIAEGLDAKSGIKLVTKTMSNPELVRALKSGSSDTIMLAAGGFLLSYHSIPSARFIRPLYYMNHVLMTRPDSTISQLSDLNGKNLSELSTTASGQAAIALLAPKADLNLGTVDEKFVSVPVGITAVEKGDLDAAPAWAPTSTWLSEQGKLKVGIDLDTAWLKYFSHRLLSGALTANKDWIAKNPDTVKKLSKVFGEAVDKLATDQSVLKVPAVQDALGINPKQSLSAVHKALSKLLITSWDQGDVDAQVGFLLDTAKLKAYQTDVPKVAVEQAFSGTVGWF